MADSLDYHDAPDYWDSSSESYESSESSESSSPHSGITVRYSTTVPEDHPRIYAYVLKVEVIGAVGGYPTHLFVFQRSKEGTAGDWVDEFIQIASPLEIEEVPENAPDPEHNMPYYRTDSVTLWFRTMEDLNLAKENIRNDIRTLTLTYDTINRELDKQEVETYE